MSRDAYGTRVYLTISTGEVLMEEVPADSALGSSHDLTLHFGLGTATVDSLRIVRPDGTDVVLDDVPVGRLWRIGYPDLTDLAFRDGFENGDLGSWSAVTD